MPFSRLSKEMKMVPNRAGYRGMVHNLFYHLLMTRHEVPPTQGPPFCFGLVPAASPEEPCRQPRRYPGRQQKRGFVHTFFRNFRKESGTGEAKKNILPLGLLSPACVSFQFNLSGQSRSHLILGLVRIVVQCLDSAPDGPQTGQVANRGDFGPTDACPSSARVFVS